MLIARVILEPHAFRGTSEYPLFSFIQKLLYLYRNSYSHLYKNLSPRSFSISPLLTLNEICVVVHISVKLFHRGITDTDAIISNFLIFFHLLYRMCSKFYISINFFIINMFIVRECSMHRRCTMGQTVFINVNFNLCSVLFFN